MKRSALFLLVPLLAACNVHAKNPAKDDDNVSIHADESGHIAFNLPIAEGKLKVPTSMMHNGNFDIDGVKLMPGSWSAATRTVCPPPGACDDTTIQGAVNNSVAFGEIDIQAGDYSENVLIYFRRPGTVPHLSSAAQSSAKAGGAQCRLALPRSVSRCAAALCCCR